MEERFIDVKEIKSLFGEITFQDYWEFFKTQNLLSDIEEKLFIHLEALSLPMKDAIMEKYAITETLSPEYRLQYPFVEKWNQINYDKFLEENKALVECFLKHNIIVKSEIAKLKNFDSPYMLPVTLTRTDFLLQHIHENDIDEIIEMLMVKEIIKAVSNNTYIIYRSFNENDYLEIPNCYRENVATIIQKKCTYTYIYRKIMKKNIENESMNDSEILYELINKGILKHTNVNFKALQKRLPDGNIYDDITAFALDKYPSQHYEKAVKKAKKIIKRTMHEPNDYLKINSRISQKHIMNVFGEKASAFLKLKDIDIKPKTIQDVLIDFEMDAESIISMFDSLPLLITPFEMKWSKNTILKLIGIGSIAALQIGVGVSLIIALPGVGALIGKVFVEEG
uniref:Uncharacterized protein n=1 Tax=Panagrolaimus davidi TaxID=227884 RepID=A0A914QFN3_9BILA